MANITEIYERLNNRRFTVADNTQGLSGTGTIFCYLVNGQVITGTYQGDQILVGNLVGRVTGTNIIELLYQCITIEEEILAGWSRGLVSQDRHQRTKLHFVWGWLSGARGEGESSYVELRDL